MLKVDSMAGTLGGLNKPGIPRLQGRVVKGSEWGRWQVGGGVTGNDMMVGTH